MFKLQGFPGRTTFGVSWLSGMSCRVYVKKGPLTIFNYNDQRDFYESGNSANVTFDACTKGWYDVSATFWVYFISTNMEHFSFTPYLNTPRK